MSLAVINLATNKTESIVSDHVRKIGQGEKGLTLEVIIMDADSSGYDLTNKVITFSENKVGGKIVVDSAKENFERLNDKAGHFRYKLADAVYAASGEAWFSISTSSGDVIDTTKSFNIDVIEDATIHVNNDNYVSTLTALETHYKSIIQRTEDDNAALLAKFNQQFQNAVNNGNNNIQKVINSANQLIANWNSQISNERQAFANLQNDWKNQTNKINSDYESQKKAIQSDANSQLADNKKAANDALAKLENDKQAAIAQANVDFRNKLNTIQTDYNNWKNSTIADFQKQIDKLQSELSDDENRQADIQKAIDAANNAIGKIKDVDFTQYAHFSDLIGYISDHNGNHLAETTGNANAIGEPGIYFTKGGIKNLPLTNWGILQVLGITDSGSDTSHRKVQIYYPDGLNVMPYYRNVTNTTISAWHQLASTDDITNLVNRINTLGKVQKVNNQWPGLDGNVNINSADNITILPDNSSFNDVIKPGFYRGNSLKDGPYTNVNDVFAVYGQKYAGGAITQVIYEAIHFDNTSRNYTRIYTRMGFFDSNLKVLWGNWNANIANIHINNTDPDNNGNININTIDNPTMLAYGSSLNNVIKPGFYQANACKDGPITDSIYNDVFCIFGVYKPGTVLTQFLPIAYYSTPDYLNNHTELYLRTAYLDNNLIAHWGAYHKISTALA